MLLRQIFEPRLAQYAYLIGCQSSREALLVDPQRDVDRYQRLAEAEGLRIVAATETHIHADFLSGVRELAACGVRAYLSAEGGDDWRYEWAAEAGAVLLRGGDRLRVGGVELQALHTPGHTPEHLSFLVVDRGGGAAEPMGLLSGDFVFVGDLGRPDLLESAAGMVGSMVPAAHALLASSRRFLELPDFLQVWPGHGAGSACGKALGAVPWSTVGYERRFNNALAKVDGDGEEFVAEMLAGQPEPPLYFARMKRLNRSGPPPLGCLPRPEPVDAARLELLAARKDTVVIDCRRDRRGYMAGHLAGSLHAPLDRTFPTIAGSYVRPEEAICLLVEEQELEEAVRALVRIGLDRMEAWAPPRCLAEVRNLKATEVVGFEGLDRPTGDSRVLLDVRSAAEFAGGHLRGATNVAHTRLLERLEALPSAATFLVYCRSGARAASAAALLERHGRHVVLVDDLLERAPLRDGTPATPAAGV